MLYTGKGDNGTTKMFDGGKDRLSKASPLPEALGTLDELNSFLGLAKVFAATQPDMRVPLGSRPKAYAAIIGDIQETLFIVQAEVAGAKKRVSAAKVTGAEALIDTLEKSMPPITTFSVAGGTELSAVLDVARTIARRAERRVIAVDEEGFRKIAAPTKAYLNRLSSVLFALARYANESKGIARQSPKYR